MDIRLLGRLEFARRFEEEKCRKYEPNGKLEEFTNLINQAVNPKETYVFITTAGNNVGKTAWCSNLAGYLGLGVGSPYFDRVPRLKNLTRPNKGRIYTTLNAAVGNYANEEIPKWFPRKRYKAFKMGRTFDCRFVFDNKSEFDLFTWDKDPSEGESTNLNWGIIDEPLPEKHWLPLKARFRQGGLIWIAMTALYHSGWVRRTLEKSDRLGKDVFKLKIRTEDACVVHGIRGHLPHEYVESLRRDADEDESSARLEGEYISLSGLVFKRFDPQYQVLKEMPEYHQECFDKGLFTLYRIMDPHDRKPFAISWFAVFPNDDIVCIAEWPDFDFYKVNSAERNIDEYRHIIIETEASLERKAQVPLIDPQFGNAPKLNGKSAKQLLAGPCGQCHERNKGLTSCPHSLQFENAPFEKHFGITLVKKLLGNPAKNIRPKLFFMDHCKNTINCFSNWYYVENKNEAKGLSEDTADEFSDFCMCAIYGALHGFKYKDIPKKQEIWKPLGGRGKYVGA